jgi:queuosine precursor transporter
MPFRICSVPRPSRLVAVYLLAIVAANLLVSHLGPGVTVINAFVFVGLDLSTRDRLHERWQGRFLWARMLGLIAAGGLLALLLGGSGRVALASSLAFIAASVADTVTYLALGRYGRLARMNGSNLVSAAVDSLCFPLLAFGWPVSGPLVLGQLIAKVGGGAIWALLLTHRPIGQQVHPRAGVRRRE